MPPSSVVLGAKIDAMRGLAIFSGAADADLGRLAEASLLRRFERGRVVMRGLAGDELVVLVRGRVKTTIPRGASCGEFAIGIFEPGEIVTEGCWAPSNATAGGETIAVEESTALFLPRRALEPFLERNAKVTFRLLAAISTKLHRVVDLAMQNSCMEVGDRLYRRLCELAQTRGRACPEGIRIQHGLHQHELAASIGASREAVNRRLAGWRDQGLVESGRRFVIVRNPAALRLAVSVAVRSEGFGTFSEA